MGELQSDLNLLAGTTGLEAQGAANVWAGTTGLDLVGALNVKAGTSGLGLDAVVNQLAGTSGLGKNLPLGMALGKLLDPSNAVGWWDARFPGGFASGPADSGGVGQLNNLCGTGTLANATQGTANAKPVASTFQGMPCLIANSAFSFFTLGSPTLAGPYTMYAVHGHTANLGTDANVYQNVAASPSAFAMGPNASPDMYGYAGGTFLHTGVVLSANKWHVSTFLWPAGGTNAQLGTDGTYGSTGNVGANTITGTDSRVGGWSDANFRFGALLIFKAAHSASQRSRIEAWLRQQWNAA